MTCINKQKGPAHAGLFYYPHHAFYGLLQLTAKPDIMGILNVRYLREFPQHSANLIPVFCDIMR